MLGFDVTTTFNMTLPAYFREFVYEASFLEVQRFDRYNQTSAHVGFKSDVISGYFGIAPVTALLQLSPLEQKSTRVQPNEVFLNFL